MTPVQILAVWFIASVAATPLLGRYLHNRRVNREFRGILDKEDAIRETELSDQEDFPTPFALDEPHQPRRSA